MTEIVLGFFTVCIEPVHVRLLFSRNKSALSLFTCLFETTFSHHALKGVFIVDLNDLIYFILAHIVLVTDSA